MGNMYVNGVKIGTVGRAAKKVLSTVFFLILIGLLVFLLLLLCFWCAQRKIKKGEEQQVIILGAMIRSNVYCRCIIPTENTLSLIQKEQLLTSQLTVLKLIRMIFKMNKRMDFSWKEILQIGMEHNFNSLSIK